MYSKDFSSFLKRLSYPEGKEKKEKEIGGIFHNLEIKKRKR